MFKNLHRYVPGLGAAAIMVALVAHFLASAAGQVPTQGTAGSCYGNDVAVGVVILIDPTTGGCFVERGTPGAPNVVSDNFEGTKATYSVAFTGLVSAVAATDVVTLDASATKTVRVLQAQIMCTGTAASVPVSIVRRSTVDTAGTPSTLTVVPNDSTDVAASAVAKTWTANPTAGTLVGALRAVTMSVEAAAAVNPPTAASFVNGTMNDKSMLLKKGSTEELAINFNGTSITSPLCTGYLEWSEE